MMAKRLNMVIPTVKYQQAKHLSNGTKDMGIVNCRSDNKDPHSEEAEDAADPFPASRDLDSNSLDSEICTVCFKTFDHDEQLKQHMEAAHGSTHGCIICSQEFDSVVSLIKHVKNHPNYCDKCKAEFPCQKQLLLHFKKIHSSMNLKKKSKSCPDCLKKFESKSEYAEHRSHRHDKKICSKIKPKKNSTPFAISKTDNNVNKLKNVSPTTKSNPSIGEKVSSKSAEATDVTSYNQLPAKTLVSPSKPLPVNDLSKGSQDATSTSNHESVPVIRTPKISNTEETKIENAGELKKVPKEEVKSVSLPSSTSDTNANQSPLKVSPKKPELDAKSVDKKGGVPKAVLLESPDFAASLCPSPDSKIVRLKEPKNGKSLLDLMSLSASDRKSKVIRSVLKPAEQPRLIKFLPVPINPEAKPIVKSIVPEKASEAASPPLKSATIKDEPSLPESSTVTEKAASLPAKKIKRLSPDLKSRPATKQKHLPSIVKSKKITKFVDSHSSLVEKSSSPPLNFESKRVRKLTVKASLAAEEAKLRSPLVKLKSLNIRKTITPESKLPKETSASSHKCESNLTPEFKLPKETSPPLCKSESNATPESKLPKETSASSHKCESNVTPEFKLPKETSPPLRKSESKHVEKPATHESNTQLKEVELMVNSRPKRIIKRTLFALESMAHSKSRSPPSKSKTEKPVTLESNIIFEVSTVPSSSELGAEMEIAHEEYPSIADLERNVEESEEEKTEDDSNQENTSAKESVNSVKCEKKETESEDLSQENADDDGSVTSEKADVEIDMVAELRRRVSMELSRKLQSLGVTKDSVDAGNAQNCSLILPASTENTKTFSKKKIVSMEQCLKEFESQKKKGEQKEVKNNRKKGGRKVTNKKVEVVEEKVDVGVFKDEKSAKQVEKKAKHVKARKQVKSILHEVSTEDDSDHEEQPLKSTEKKPTVKNARKSRVRSSTEKSNISQVPDGKPAEKNPAVRSARKSEVRKSVEKSDVSQVPIEKPTEKNLAVRTAKKSEAQMSVEKSDISQVPVEKPAEKNSVVRNATISEVRKSVEKSDVSQVPVEKPEKSAEKISAVRNASKSKLPRSVEKSDVSQVPLEKPDEVSNEKILEPKAKRSKIVKSTKVKVPSLQENTKEKVIKKRRATVALSVNGSAGIQSPSYESSPEKLIKLDPCASTNGSELSTPAPILQIKESVVETPIKKSVPKMLDIDEIPDEVLIQMLIENFKQQSQSRTDEALTCPTCNKRFSRIKALESHLKLGIFVLRDDHRTLLQDYIQFPDEEEEITDHPSASTDNVEMDVAPESPISNVPINTSHQSDLKLSFVRNKDQSSPKKCWSVSPKRQNGVEVSNSSPDYHNGVTIESADLSSEYESETDDEADDEHYSSIISSQPVVLLDDIGHLLPSVYEQRKTDSGDSSAGSTPKKERAYDTSLEKTFSMVEELFKPVRQETVCALCDARFESNADLMAHVSAHM